MLYYIYPVYSLGENNNFIAQKIMIWEKKHGLLWGMLLANDLDMLHMHQDCNEGLMEWKKERSKSNSMCHLIGLSSASGIKKNCLKATKSFYQSRRLGLLKIYIY